MPAIYRNSEIAMLAPASMSIYRNIEIEMAVLRILDRVDPLATLAAVG